MVLQVANCLNSATDPGFGLGFANSLASKVVVVLVGTGLGVDVGVGVGIRVDVIMPLFPVRGISGLVSCEAPVALATIFRFVA